VLLTTQYLDEADQLADRIAIVDHGRVIAEGTAGELKASVGSGALHVRMRDAARRPAAARLLTELLAVPVELGADPAVLAAGGADPSEAAVALGVLARTGMTVDEFSMGQPSLDEVFLALTGHAAEESGCCWCSRR
jgi:ABC-2 type transport system ATP-binding protein